MDYASGHTNRADVAAARAVLTGVNQITAQVSEHNAEKLDTEYFEVSWHPCARPDHQTWQGKVFSRKELGTVCGYGTVTGLCGANCRHTFHPFIPGVSERLYPVTGWKSRTKGKPRQKNGTAGSSMPTNRPSSRGRWRPPCVPSVRRFGC